MTLFPRLRRARRDLAAAQSNLAAERVLRAASANRVATLTTQLGDALAELTAARAAADRLQNALEERLGVAGWCIPCADDRHRHCRTVDCACKTGQHPARPVYAPGGDLYPGAAPSEPRDWWFTFGASHVHPITGAPLKDCYVMIYGGHDRARAEMRVRFGDGWSWQYGNAADAGVLDWCLTQLEGPASLGLLAAGALCELPSDVEDRQLVAIEAGYEAGRDD